MNFFKTEQEFRAHPNWKEIYDGMSRQEIQDHDLPLVYIVREIEEERKAQTLKKNLVYAKTFMSMRCSVSKLTPEVIIENDLKVLQSVIDRISKGKDDFMSDAVKKSAIDLQKSLDEAPRTGNSIQFNGYTFVNWYLFVIAKMRENNDLKKYGIRL